MRLHPRLQRAAIGKLGDSSAGLRHAEFQTGERHVGICFAGGGDIPIILAETNKPPWTPSDADPTLTCCFSVISGRFWTPLDGDLVPGRSEIIMQKQGVIGRCGR
jgi:hypothetical protein